MATNVASVSLEDDAKSKHASELMTDGGHHENELVDRAVREATDLIDAGDSEHVAISYVIDKHDLEHRREDIRERLNPESATDGGNLKEVFRRETITAAPNGDLQIGDREFTEEIDDVCATLEALQDQVDNSDVKAALQSATGHAWRVSIFQRVDENTDIRMITTPEHAGVAVRDPDPDAFKRDGGGSQ